MNLRFSHHCTDGNWVIVSEKLPEKVPEKILIIINGLDLSEMFPGWAKTFSSQDIQIIWHRNILYVTLDHKTSHKGQIEVYTSSESWINKLSIDVCLLG